MVNGLLKIFRNGKFIMMMPRMKKITHDSRSCRCRNILVWNLFSMIAAYRTGE